MSRAKGENIRKIPRQISPAHDFVQFFGICRIYWQGYQNAKEETDMRPQINSIGDVDDLIFQDCWLASDR